MTRDCPINLEIDARSFLDALANTLSALRSFRVPSKPVRENADEKRRRVLQRELRECEWVAKWSQYDPQSAKDAWKRIQQIKRELNRLA